MYGMKGDVRFCPAGAHKPGREKEHKDMYLWEGTHPPFSSTPPTSVLRRPHTLASGVHSPPPSILPQNLPTAPLSALPLCLAEFYSSFRFQLRYHFFQENTADHPNLGSGAPLCSHDSSQPTTSLTVAFFIIQSEFPVYSSLSPHRLRWL